MPWVPVVGQWGKDGIFLFFTSFVELQSSENVWCLRLQDRLKKIREMIDVW
jgi:hypothetical protein